MKQTILIVFLGLGLITPGKTFINTKSLTTFTPADNDSLLKSTWTKFSNAVLNKDFKSLKFLSTDSILCVWCVTNTQIEDSLFEIFKIKNENIWYEKLYTQFCFISTENFIKEDFEFIFTDKIKTRLLDTTKLNFTDDNHNAKLYLRYGIIGTIQKVKPDFREVLLTSIDPNLNFEGSQFAFAFVKLNGQYKFCGFSTIP